MKAIRSWSSLFVSAVLLFLTAAGKTAERPYLEKALQAAEWILSAGVETDSGITWAVDPDATRSLDDSLYSGTPGVVLFLLEAYRSTGEKRYIEAARAGADHLLSVIPLQEDAGFYTGMSGTGFALEETFKATGDRRYRQGVNACLDRIKERASVAGRGIEWGPVTDIISGNAGTALFLLYAARSLDDSSLLRLAARAGNRLSELGIPENKGLKWAMSPDYPRLMPNFSHGTAGAAYFLATLALESGDDKHLEPALAGARYLTSIAETEGDVCLVFHHEPDGKDLFYLGWCHGPAGTGQLFQRLYQATGDEGWWEWLWRSARALTSSGIPESRTPGFWNNAGLCCGLAGIGDFFLNLYLLYGDESHLDFCRRVADELLKRSSLEDGKRKWVQAEHRTRPDLLLAQTGLMQGASGIGLYLLRMDAFEQKRPRLIRFPDSPFLP